jgi:small redox-active disulfide protein 1
MKKILLELFTSPTCPHCPTAKRIVGNAVKQMEDVLLIERDVSIPENANIAKEYGISGVPTLVINNKYRITGAPRSEDEVIRVIEQID